MKLNISLAELKAPTTKNNIIHTKHNMQENTAGAT